MSLTGKQARFVEEYLVDLNATQAAVRAGYSKRTANQQGARLLANVGIATAVADGMASRSERTRVTADAVLLRLAEAMEADLADLYDDDQNLRPVKDWPPIWRKGLVAGIEVEELFEGSGEDREHIGRVRKLKLSDRIRIIELVGKHVDVQAFKEKVDHEGALALTPSLNVTVNGKPIFS